MTDEQTKARSPRRGGARLWLVVLLLLMSLGGVCAAAWRLDRMLVDQRQQLEREGRRLDALQQDAAQARERVGGLTRDAETARQRLGTLESRQQSSEHQLSDLAQIAHTGGRRLQLDAVEQLLLLANERARLADDLAGALDAQRAADARLAQLDDPVLLPVRQALAQEMQALAAVPRADAAGLSLQLSGFIDASPAWSLQHLPAVERREAVPAAMPPGSGLWARGGEAVRRVLSQLFQVQRTTQPVEPVLSSQEQGLVGEVLQLRLETARAALLQRDTATFRTALSQAHAWLAHYYRADDPRVGAALSSLVQMQAQDLRPPLPDLSRSGTLLRAQLVQAGGG